jgi:1,4-alpha-glucan branching enzyme
MLTDFDLYLFGTGQDRYAYRHMGAHPIERDGIAGVDFAVWAPSARAVSVIGDFNYWTPGSTALQPSGDSGVWQGFVPGIGPGSLYKFAIQPHDSDTWLQKADPYAAAAQLRPHTASVVADLDGYEWRDGDWVQRRAATDWGTQPMSVYELHLSSWRRDPSNPQRFLSYGELADQLPQYVRDLGFTHVQFLPLAEHPLDMSWGYQTTGYFAPTARFGTPKDFMGLVDALHQAGLGVLVDWVPAHFPKDAHGLGRFDGSALYEHADPRQGEHPDWGTYIFNYGRDEVKTFLLSNALMWFDRYHVDGLRVDAVASMLYLDYSRESGQWIPNRYGGRENIEAIDLVRYVNSVVHEEFPGGLTIAEESTAWPRVSGSVESGGLGFDFKWNMGWMHDTLQYMEREPIYRRYHQNELTFSLMYAFTERFVLPFSHDEVVHGKGSLLNKMPGDAWQKFANLRLLYGYMWGHPGKKLIFMGSEFGQWAEWNYAQSLDWHLLDLPGEEGYLHRGVLEWLRALNEVYAAQSPLFELDADWQGFQWIDFSDADASVLAFMRRSRGGERFVIFACNFTPVVRQNYRIGLPAAGSYTEVLNSDDLRFSGSGVLNGDVESEAAPWHGQPFSTTLTLPPLGVCILVPRTP